MPGDSAATANAITESLDLFRIGLLGFIVMVIADVLVSWALYVLFVPVNKGFSLLAAWLRLVNSALFGIEMVYLFDVLQLLSSAEYADALGLSLLQAQVMLSLNGFDMTWLIGLIFFGLHLVMLGYLIVKSGFIPKIIGMLLFIAAFGYLIDSFAHLLLPSASYEALEAILTLLVIVPGIVGELSLTLWLLIKGVTEPGAE